MPLPKTAIVIIVAAMVALASGGGSLQTNKRQHMNENSKIESQAEAITRAISLTGLDSVSKKATPERTTVAEDRTPFLSQQFNGKSVWRVRFGPGSLKLKSAEPGFVDKYERIFDVLLDERTGQLIGLSSHFSGAARDMRPEPSAASAEKQLRATSEVYLGLPTVDPKVTFLSALDAVLTNGVGSPFLAKEIDGLYILDTSSGSAPRPVWVITLRGLLPIPALGPVNPAHVPEETAPIWQRNHMRNVVDATTGKFLFATNYPNPE